MKLSVSVIAMILFILCISPGKSTNYFNIITGNIKCNKYSNCLHEAAHKADRCSGWISQTKEYQDAVNDYRNKLWWNPEDRDINSMYINQFPGVGSPKIPTDDPFTYGFWTGGWGGYNEFYAETASWYNKGTIPKELKQFYDFDYIETTAKNAMKVNYGK
jgi:hypothetical protein